MKKTLLMAGALLALTAGVASAAAGINLSWNDCGSFGGVQRNFACGNNSGANTMYASAIAPVPMDAFNGHAGVLDLQTNQAALSNWWLIGTCRLASTMSADYNFLSSSNCLDPWAGVAAGGISYTAGFGGLNRARIRTVCAISPSTAIDDVSEYYIAKVTFTNAKSFGNGSCGGCSDGACIVLNSIQLTQPLGAGDYTISSPILRNWVQWQGGATGITGGCPAATPTRNKTWGSVKSLYR